MKLLVIDGNSIMNRAFYGIRVLTNKKGMPTNALTGFLNIFLKLMKEEAPDRIAVAFDLHAPTFRHKMYADYKGTRHAMPDELRAQMPIIKQILTALGVAIVEKEGYEADDIIGTLSHAAEAQGGECTISTGDRDSFQLITDKVTVRLASNKEDIIYTPAKIAEVYGVTPREMLEVKTLMGDSSDNIPGVPGVGEKTALGLIQKYHTVDYIYQNLDAIEVTKGVRAKLENGRESAELSRKLAEITLEAPVELDMSAYEKKDGDPAEAAGILTEMEMFGVMKKLGLDKTAPAKVALASIASISSEGTAPAPDNVGTPAVEAAEKADIPEFDPAAYDVAFYGGEVRVFLAGKPQEGAAAILASEAPKRTDDAKALYSYCMKNGMELKNVVFDAALAGYLLNVNSSDYTVERLCAEYGVTYSAERLGESLFLLNRALWEKIHQQEMYGVLADIEIPLAEVLSSMEIEGVKLDTEALREFGDALQPKIKEIEQDIYKEAGHEFNIGSPKQLSVVLFEELGLPAGKKRKTGYSTDADTLDVGKTARVHYAIILPADVDANALDVAFMLPSAETVYRVAFPKLAVTDRSLPVGGAVKTNNGAMLTIESAKLVSSIDPVTSAGGDTSVQLMEGGNMVDVVLTIQNNSDTDLPLGTLFSGRMTMDSISRLGTPLLESDMDLQYTGSIPAGTSATAHLVFDADGMSRDLQATDSYYLYADGVYYPIVIEQ